MAEFTNKKVCPKCLKNKSLEKFKPRPDGSQGSYCYPCSLQYYREYNKERYKTRKHASKRWGERESDIHDCYDRHGSEGRKS